MSISPLGDRALLVTLGTAINEPTRRRVQALTRRIRAANLRGVTDVVPAFAAVAVHYDPRIVAPSGALPYDVMATSIAALFDLGDAGLTEEPRVVEIVVCYCGECGPDLPHVAGTNGLAQDEVVAMHAAARYRVHMIGFMPGFAYLGGLDPRLATPRRESPRKRVPASSVGIGGEQTGVYPFESPGGWQLIGRTPLRMFDPHRNPASLLDTGDTVKFRPIAHDEYARLTHG